jgi:hypothetical protein
MARRFPRRSRRSRRKDAERAIDPRNAFIMQTLLRDVITSGTATRALQLKRKDLAARRHDERERRRLVLRLQHGPVGIAWIGYDQPRRSAPTKRAAAALPIWIGYMQRALKGVPEALPDAPPGVVSLRINPRRDSATTRAGCRTGSWPSSRHACRWTPSRPRDAGRSAVTRRARPAVLGPITPWRQPALGTLRKPPQSSGMCAATPKRAGAFAGSRPHRRLAARLIAEHGIADWSLAKRKACVSCSCPSARRSGRRRDRVALTAHHALFGGERHAETLRAQREERSRAAQSRAFEPR